MSDLSRIDDRLCQVVELLRCLLSEIRETRRALADGQGVRSAEATNNTTAAIKET